ncbi:DUF3768 domain-containing protein [Antarctobacter sp.]|uniref:DUF3768 domain-containing protein n=1 Tax=Antarctobacter sp. TaxID=1872577 RepID=UPI002B269AB1|nr:DUF3768 domain-containing protein [Antarctobacter sp.]
MTETPDQFHETADDLDAETRAIRTLNDNLRRTFSCGRVVMTQGVQALAEDTVYRILKAVREFNDFSEDNDPYGTHEFGLFDQDDERVMFKIDAYDQNLEYGSPNPADPTVTTRVLTILLASEY